MQLLNKGLYTYTISADTDNNKLKIKLLSDLHWLIIKTFNLVAAWFCVAVNKSQILPNQTVYSFMQNNVS